MAEIVILSVDREYKIYGVVVSDLQAVDIQNTLDCCILQYRETKVATLGAFLEYKGVSPEDISEGLNGPVLYYRRLSYSDIRTIRNVVGKNFKIEDAMDGGIIVIVNIKEED